MRLMEDERILLARGEEKGRAEGRREGELKKLIAQICRKLKNAKSLETIAEELEEDITLIRSICEAAGRCAPEYDVDKIYELLEH
ncbi:MAG: hypothetical protein K2I10_01550 [Lachnospiraceae bacterium]|nr:hypothetical protein [Lachnospiraceae bacterium]